MTRTPKVEQPIEQRCLDAAAEGLRRARRALEESQAPDHEPPPPLEED
jgi:hypothetical protein